MMELAVKLIKSGVLYADDTPVEQMREVRLFWSPYSPRSPRTPLFGL